MGLRIIYGKSGSGKSEYIYNEINLQKRTVPKWKNIYNNTRAIFIYSRAKTYAKQKSRNRNRGSYI